MDRLRTTEYRGKVNSRYHVSRRSGTSMPVALAGSAIGLGDLTWRMPSRRHWAFLRKKRLWQSSAP